MSRSRKKTAITGNTTARSEKKDKRLANRAMRRLVRSLLDSGEDDTSIPDRRAVRNVWSFDKDGKSRFDADEHPRLMRK